ncbi:MAG TPA: alpha-glucosidase [Terriglobales bacterium]|nr:alpha-glucosidase [Terriglobales bacterium]
MRRPRIACTLVLLLLSANVIAQIDPRGRETGIGMPANKFANSNGWWKHAVVYEIYPRSYGDSNNDGTGDLNGITQHLDHLSRLGVDAIWITPCFPSPQVDFGYDVSDYRNIDPQYGTLADFDRLVAEAKRRNIKVILDFVVNHTSDKHRWFQESEKSKTNPYRDYYVWRDGKGSGQPPNNWTSTFGGPSWTFSDATNQWYYHFFYPQQPDLNWRNAKVENEMFDVTRFWYRRGVYGFRLDAVDTLFEDPNLTDNPPLSGTDAYGMPIQEHIHDHSPAEVHAELRKLRKVADQYPGRVLIGETWTNTPEELAEYYGPANDELQMPMYFNFTKVQKLDANEFREKVAAIESNPVHGWPVYVLSNHDIRRYVDRYGNDHNKDQIAKLMSALYLTLRGSAIMYYGEEIGMENNDPKRVEDVKDVIGKKGWPKEIGRDGERTPMQWDTSVNAGFNKGAAPWLPVDANYTTHNVATESADPNSVLNWYRSLIRLRRTNPAFYDGSYVALNESDPNVMAYLRKSSAAQAIVILNFSADRQAISLDKSKLRTSHARVLLATNREMKNVDLSRVELGPNGVLILDLSRAAGRVRRGVSGN